MASTMATAPPSIETCPTRSASVMRKPYPDAGGRSFPWHQDLCEGPALEALLVDDVELQVLLQLGEGAAARADRNRDRGQLILVDQAQAGQRLGEVGAAVDQHRPFVVPSLEFCDRCAQIPAENLGRSPFRLLQSA